MIVIDFLSLICQFIHSNVICIESRCGFNASRSLLVMTTICYERKIRIRDPHGWMEPNLGSIDGKMNMSLRTEWKKKGRGSEGQIEAGVICV